jgi:hypothetical protein
MHRVTFLLILGPYLIQEDVPEGFPAQRVVIFAPGLVEEPQQAVV